MISSMRARVLAQKSEEATASSASLLATPLTGSVGWKKWPGDEAKLGLEKACTVT